MPVCPDWYACLSVALDTEEDEWYNQQYLAFIAAGGDPKKFPRRPRRYIPPSKTVQKNPYDLVVGAMKQSGVKIGAARGTVSEYARARGLQKVYQMPDGTFTDENGNPVEPTPGSVFVKV